MARPILIVAGGTGGHIFPALAVADHLRSLGVPLLWLGTAQGMESSLVPQAGYQLLTITIRGVRRKGWLSMLLAPVRIGRALFQSLRLLLQKRPGAVLGMGGFVSGPAGIAAWLLRVPLLLHEQNAVAGFTNSVLAHFARQVLEAFPGTIKRSDVICTGNPVRRSIAELPPPAQRWAQRSELRRVLVFGGSQGAQALNETVPAALARLPGLQLEIRHQTGKSSLEATRNAYHGHGLQAQVEPFIADMAAAYGWADLVICRAGALTVAELAAAGVGAILVPFPGAVDDHQTVNARYLSDAEAAELLPQSELSVERLAGVLTRLLSGRDKLLDMAQRARALARTDATERVAGYLLELSRA